MTRLSPEESKGIQARADAIVQARAVAAQPERAVAAQPARKRGRGRGSGRAAPAAPVRGRGFGHGRGHGHGRGRGTVPNDEAFSDSLSTCLPVDEFAAVFFARSRSLQPKQVQPC